jgi:pimeloyl-ACP methyl ester carboxylesterase
VASKLNGALTPPQQRLRHRLVCIRVRGLLILLLAAAFVPAASSASPLANGLPSSFVLVRTGPAGGTVWEGRILDRQVNDPRLSDVYLPPDFSPALRYPVVIFLHGFWGSPSSFVHGLHLAETADQEITAGRARPFIGVMPPGGPMTKTTSDEWAGVWENYVIRDVVPWIDAHFLTVPSRSAIAGLSAGGYGAVDMGLRHPTMFHTLESWGGYFKPFLDGPFVDASPSVLRAHTPTLLVSREAQQLRKLGTRFFLSTGKSGHGDVKARWTFEFSDELARLRLPHKLWVLPAAKRGHLFRTQLPAAIDYASPA